MHMTSTAADREVRVGEVQAHSHGRTSLLLFLCVLAGSVH